MSSKQTDDRAAAAGRRGARVVSFAAGTAVGSALREAKGTLVASCERGDWDEAIRHEARLEAEVLLSEVLAVGRAQLMAHPERLLSPSEALRYTGLLQRRIEGEPTAYITGHREFFGLDFLVDRRVLIPRPETELLVERAIAEAKHRANGEVRIADVGTGSGAIAISLAVNLPRAIVYATDISPGALDVAASNAARLGAGFRVTFLQGDLLSPLPEAVDIVVANLPYLSPTEFATLQREVALFEPPLALFAEENGLAIYRRLLHDSRPCLRPGGALLMEISPQQAESAIAMVKRYLPGAMVTLDRDYAGLDRLIFAEVAS